MKTLLDYICSVRGIDFSLYRPATIMRKLDLRLGITGKKDYADYLSFLRTDQEELQKLVQTLTIKVSSFFRDSKVFDALSSQIMPMLIAEFGSVRAWSIGCAEGEEPYSLAILARDILNAGRLSFSLNIHGTDIDPAAIEKAKRGEYSDEELIEMKKEVLDRYFSKIESRHSEYGHARWLISKEIRSMVHFDCFNIIDLLTERRTNTGRYNLILCRNVLIYFNREVQEKILENLSLLLYEGGYLVLGKSETLPEALNSRFEQPAEELKIFRRLDLPAYK